MFSVLLLFIVVLIAAMGFGGFMLLVLAAITHAVAGPAETTADERPAPRDVGFCGHCRYSVHGLTTFICPECGSDLREVGIRRGRLAAPRKRSSPGLALTGLGMLTVALILSGGVCLIAIALNSLFRW